jgi:hypothetical protein
MAKLVHQPARSQRFIRAYLMTWGVLAAAALGFLATLAWRPELIAPPSSRARPVETEAEQTQRIAAKALAEVGSVRRNLTQIEKDLTEVKDTLGSYDAHRKSVEQRLDALEERAAATEVALATAATQPKQKPDKPSTKAAEPRAPAPTVASAAPIPERSARPGGHAAPLQTGSIGSAPAITFGPAVVTPAKEAAAYGVQLAVAPSIEALRASWGLLVERHGATLATLRPHVVPPRSEGAPYRLVAGPLPSDAEARRLCAELQARQASCTSTTVLGEPL